MDSFLSTFLFQYSSLTQMLIMVGGFILLFISPVKKGRVWLLVFILCHFLTVLVNSVHTQLQISDGMEMEKSIRYLLWGVSGIFNGASWSAFFLYLGALVLGGEYDIKKMLFSFKNRISRKAMWLFACAMIPINVAVIFGAFPIMFSRSSGGAEIEFDHVIPLIVVAVLWLPVAAWIAFAVQVKRWHDRGKSGWWIFINLIPIVGGIWTFIELYCLKGIAGPNNYGDEPGSELGYEVQKA